MGEGSRHAAVQDGDVGQVSGGQPDGELLEGDASVADVLGVALHACVVVAKAVEPAIIVPMHYRERTAGWDVTSGVPPFLDHFGQVTFHDRASFIVDDTEPGVLVLKNPII